jgi:hypothetical protein
MYWHPYTVEQLVATCLLIEFKEYLMRIDIESRRNLLGMCESFLETPQKFLRETNTDLARLSACGEWISTLRRTDDISAHSPIWDILHTNFLSGCIPFMELVEVILHKKL